NDLKYAVASAGTEIIRNQSWLFLQLLDCLDMSYGQVYHMNIISYPGSVRCIIIIPKHIDFLQLAQCHLCYIRHKIVGNSIRILPDFSAFMGTYRVKIS